MYKDCNYKYVKSRCLKEKDQRPILLNYLIFVERSFSYSFPEEKGHWLIKTVKHRDLL